MIKKSRIIQNPADEKFYNCELQPYRNAGDSPECWYYNKFANITDRSVASESNNFTDCLHQNGSSYQGNISVTASGIPCQSWTEQCPHRHTMNTTYPELNLAKNYCRNPQNSGKQPWCFTTDRNTRWEYCDIPKCTAVDGNYGNWTPHSTCNVSCGQGFEIWKRECNNPEPKYGGKNCSHLGEDVEHKPCFEKNCPVDGDYGNWTLSVPCNISCGVGIEIWRRSCDKPIPKYGGRNCSELGNSTEIRKCSREPCPVDGKYSNWTRSSSCSTTCGKGFVTWTRRCDNPPGKYGGNCSKHGPAQELRICETTPCPVFFDSEMIGVTTGAAVFVLVSAITAFLLILRRRHRKQGYSSYRLTNIFSRSLQSHQEAEGATSSQETASRAEYANQTNNGDPIPGLSRGVMMHTRDYINERPSRNLWYDRLQLIRPIAINWLRNAWGNVDEFGRHDYDVMQHRVREIFVPYDKLASLPPGDSARNEIGNSSETYDQIQRPLTTIALPSRCGNFPTTEIT